MGIKVNSLRRTPVLEAPAHRLTQGERTVYYFALSMAQFDDVLPEEVDSKVIRESQRRFIPSHARGIEDYLSKTDKWVLGPVTLSIDPEFVLFEPYPGQEDETSPILGELKIIQGGKPFLKILDGQHRRWAIRHYRTAQAPTEAFEQQRKAFEKCEMPVALYEESDTQGIRQMFADMAQQRKMDAVTTARFDMRDPFNQAADRLMEESEWIGPYVEMDSSTVARTSTKLVAFNQLAVNLKTLEYGYYGRASRTRAEEVALGIDRLVEAGKQWTDEFLPSARDEYLELLTDVDPDYVPLQRPRTLAYNGTILRILAGCHYEWRKQYPDLETDTLADFINEMDFNPKQRGGPLVESGILDLKRATLVARRQEVQAAISTIVKDAHKALELEELAVAIPKEMDTAGEETTTAK